MFGCEVEWKVGRDKRRLADSNCLNRTGDSENYFHRNRAKESGKVRLESRGKRQDRGQLARRRINQFKRC